MYGLILVEPAEGGGSLVNHDVQTTMIPAGGSAITEFRADAPSTYVLVDHAIFRATDKGAMGMLQVSGERNPVIFDGVDGGH